MRAPRLRTAVAFIAVVLLAASLLAACGDSGGSSSKNDTTGGVANSNLDTAKAVETQVTVAKGGVAEVDAGNGAVADVYIPPNAVKQDMTVVVTSLLKAENQTGNPLVPGISVVQKGNESQHIALDVPALVSITVPGKVSKKAQIVAYPEGSTDGQVLPTSLVFEKGMTTATAVAPGFTIFRLEADSEGKLVDKYPDYKWRINVDDSVAKTIQGARITTTAQGTLQSNLMFSQMTGYIEFEVSVWYKQGLVWAKLNSSVIEGDPEITSSSLRIINKKSFVYTGYGQITFKGDVSLDAAGGVGGTTIEKNVSGSAGSPANLMIQITTSLPGKQGQSVPGKMTVSTAKGKLVFKCSITRNFGKE